MARMLTKNFTGLNAKTLISISLKEQRYLFFEPSSALIYSNSKARSYATGSTSDLTKYKRGRGGRSSFSGLVCTVFGASGYLGSFVVNHLAKAGSQVITVFREDPITVRDLKVLGDLGQIIPLPFHIKDDESIRRAVKYSNVVINLLGREQESINYTFHDLHVDFPQRLAKICRESGVKTLLQMSSINASPSPKSYFIKGGSNWLKSKYHGEVLVQEEFPEAIIFRAADIFGNNRDRFLNYYASRWRHFVPLTAITEVWERGNNTEKQPVYVDDVARGIMAAVSQPKISHGLTFEIVGPYRYNQGEMLDYMYACMRRDTDEYDVSFTTRYRRIPPTPMMNIKCFIADKFRWVPYRIFHTIHWEKIECECHTDRTTPTAPRLDELGVMDLTNLEDRAKYDLRTIREAPGYGLPEELGILDPVELDGKYPKRLPNYHIEPV